VMILIVFFPQQSGGNARASVGANDQEDASDGHKNELVPYLLLTKRPEKMKSHPGQVCFPGGKQDEADGNDDVFTAVRETWEEVGIRLLYGDSRTTSALTESAEASTRTIGRADQLPQQQHAEQQQQAEQQAEQGGKEPTKYPMELLCQLPTVESSSHLCVTAVVGCLQWKEGTADPNMTQKAFLDNLKLSEDEVEAAFLTPLSTFLEEHETQEIVWQGEPFTMRTFHWMDPHHQRSFRIWGLTAALSHWVAKIALHDEFPRELGGYLHASTNGSAAPVKPASNDNSSLTGYLWRSSDESLSTKHWKRFYYALENGMLHQYDSEQQYLRKRASANKKNRLVLHDVAVAHAAGTKQEQGHASSVDGDVKMPFEVSVLDGRVRWYLAADSRKERNEWTERLGGKLPSSS